MAVKKGLIKLLKTGEIEIFSFSAFIGPAYLQYAGARGKGYCPSRFHYHLIRDVVKVKDAVALTYRASLK